MLKFILFIFFMSAISVSAADLDMHNRPLRLKDGSYLFINMDETTDMMDKKGNPIKMKDGVEMELEDGSLIMMKNEKVWHLIHKDKKK
jgi:hypothetical protein